MSSQEIEIYVAIANGLYLYDARFHQLVELSTEDIRSFCGTQGYVANAPFNLIYVANFSKLGDMEDDRKLFYAAADTGFISQNVYLILGWERLPVIGSTGLRWHQKSICMKIRGLFCPDCRVPQIMCMIRYREIVG